MITGIGKLKKMAFLFLLGTVVAGFQAKVLAYWGENSDSMATDYHCQIDIFPAVDGGGPEYWYGYDLTDCYEGDWEACSESGWLHLDFAWACNADCEYNGGSWHGDYDAQGFCDGQCRCSNGL